MKQSIIKIIIIFIPLSLLTAYIVLNRQSSKKPGVQRKEPRIDTPLLPNNNISVQNKEEVAPDNEPERQDTTNEPELFDKFLSEKDKILSSYKWDQIDALITKYEQEFSVLKDRFTLYKLDLLKKKKEALDAFNHYMNKANSLIEEQKIYEAAIEIDNALANYPAKSSEITQLINRLKTSIVTDMIEVPATTIQTGIKEGRPVTETVEPFKISRFEITNKQYAVYVLLTGAKPPRIWNGKKPPTNIADMPVFMVNHYDATNFAEWLGKRLPTEKEWIAACSFDDMRKFPWGNEFSTKDDDFPAVTVELCESINKFFPHPVGSKKAGASKLGIMDLAGNVWEWTSTSVSQDNQIYYILKGGSFMTYKEAVSCDHKMIDLPEMEHIDVGFRIAADD